MDKLRAIRLFVRLADLGNFTKVGDQENMSKSMVSKEISRLESHLGTRLLHRSTRNVTLTHAGEGYLEYARSILEKVNESDDFVQDLQQGLKGRLKINLPMTLGLTDLSEFFASFMQENPNIELDIHLGDESIDLVDEGFDLAFRASSKQIDSAYIGRPLKNFSYKICAAPQYLQNSPPIHQPKDLKNHNCFVYTYFRGKNIWPIDDGVPIKGNLKANSALFMLSAIKRGLGIGFLPDFACQQYLDSNELVEILKDSKKTDLTLYALYPARQHVPPKVIQCIRSLEAWFASKQNTIS